MIKRPVQTSTQELREVGKETGLSRNSWGRHSILEKGRLMLDIQAGAEGGGESREWGKNLSKPWWWEINMICTGKGWRLGWTPDYVHSLSLSVSLSPTPPPPPPPTRLGVCPKQDRNKLENPKGEQWGFPDGSVVKNPPVNAGSSPGSGRCSREGKGNPVLYSCLENPIDRGAWQVTGHEVAKELDTTERLNNNHHPWSPCQQPHGHCLPRTRYACMQTQSLSRIWLFATPWTVVCPKHTQILHK